MFVAPGGSGGALSRLISELETGGSEADVFLGLADVSLGRALDHDVFEPYDPALLSNLPDVPTELLVDPSQRLIPFDYGYVALVCDRRAWVIFPCPEAWKT